VKTKPWIVSRENTRKVRMKIINNVVRKVASPWKAVAKTYFFLLSLSRGRRWMV